MDTHKGYRYQERIRFIERHYALAHEVFAQGRHCYESTEAQELINTARSEIQFVPPSDFRAFRMLKEAYEGVGGNTNPY